MDDGAINVALFRGGLIAACLIGLFVFQVNAQQKNTGVQMIGDSTAFKPGMEVVLSGVIRDAKTGKSIEGVTIYIERLNTGTVTDASGRYQITLPPGSYSVRFQYLGMETVNRKIHLLSDGHLNITMREKSLSMDEVIIKGNAQGGNVKSAVTGINELNIAQISQLPSLLGVSDVVHTLLLLPGVNTVGEGASGFNVRGGMTDQNLVLLNGAPLFNSSHVLGLFSVFNPDAVDNFTLYKGYIPARFGGRLSSVLDVHMKEGDYDRYQVKGGVGIASGRLSVQGPIVKDKTSFLAGVRSTYSDWVLGLAQNLDVKRSKAGFYDANINLSQRFDENNRVELSFYGSHDNFRYSDKFGYSWGTKLGNLRWDKIFSNHLMMEVSAVFGDYSSSNYDPQGFDASVLNNGIRYDQFKSDFLYKPNGKHMIDFGAERVDYNEKPETIGPYNKTSNLTFEEVSKGRGRTLSLYVSDDYTISSRLLLSLGLRYSLFQDLGPGNVYSYQAGMPRDVSTITDSTQYGRGKVIAHYAGFEPRVSIRYNLDAASSVKISYVRMQQFIHQISNSTSSTPADIWQVSNTFIPGEKADNFSVGYYRNFNDDTWETSLELFYKRTSDLLLYKNFAQLHLNNHLETELLEGKGKAYGVELSIKKTSGKWTGWLSYAYTRSLERSTVSYPSEQVNGNDWFPSDFDRPQNISLVAKRQIAKRSAFSFSIVYDTGRPITAIVSSYEQGQTIIPEYSSRNGYRIPDYIRLDVSFTIGDNIWKNRVVNPNKKYHDSLTISFYNVLGRENAYSVFYKRPPDLYIPQSYKLSVLGTIIPSVTYNFNF